MDDEYWYYHADTCIACHNQVVVEVDHRDKQGYEAFMRDPKTAPLIQNALPNTPADTREFILSSCCPDCFDRMFSE